MVTEASKQADATVVHKIFCRSQMWFSRRCLCYCLMENLFWSLNDRHIEDLSTKIVLA